MKPSTRIREIYESIPTDQPNHAAYLLDKYGTNDRMTVATIQYLDEKHEAMHTKLPAKADMV